jgi:hypothetical protein
MTSQNLVNTLHIDYDRFIQYVAISSNVLSFYLGCG